MKAVIAGAGWYGQVYLNYLTAEKDLSIVGFLDDDPGKRGSVCQGLPIVGATEDLAVLRELDVEAVFAPIGDNRVRKAILERAQAEGFATPGYVHPSVALPEDTVIGEGVYVLPGTLVMPFTTIHNWVMVSMGVRIAHHVTLSDGVFLSMGATVGAGVTIEECSFLGIACTVMTGVQSVGSDSLVGAGAVVIRDVPDGATVVGNPSRPIRT